MLKCHRVALRPTSEQESLFLQHAAFARFAYNWAVGEFKPGLEMGEWLTERSLRPRWNLVASHRALGRRAIPERGQVRHHRPGSGQFEVGRVPKEAEAGHQLQTGGIPPLQAPSARAGIPG